MFDLTFRTFLKELRQPGAIPALGILAGLLWVAAFIGLQAVLGA